jgi:transcriptional regulator GlxA family with amidase domain
MSVLSRKIAVLLWHNVELLDFAGPVEVFTVADIFTTKQNMQGFEAFTVSVDGKPLLSQKMLTIMPQYLIQNCPSHDILIIPGGNTQFAREQQALLDFIIQQRNNNTLLFSVCTGSLILAKAGLLKGMKATTFHEQFDELQSLSPDTTVIRDKRVVDTGSIITAAGISSGIDASLYLVAKLTNQQIAKATAEYIEYSWHADSVS